MLRKAEHSLSGSPASLYVFFFAYSMCISLVGSSFIVCAVVGEIVLPRVRMILGLKAHTNICYVWTEAVDSWCFVPMCQYFLRPISH